MPNPWFKFFGGDYLSDQKIYGLSAAERSCWVTLLCFASQSNGSVKFLTEEQIMRHAGIAFGSDDWQKTEGVLQKLEKLNMLVTHKDEIEIANWRKRQESFLSGAERTAKYRHRMSVTSASHPRHIRSKKVTLDIDTEGEVDTDEDKRRKKKESAATAAPAPKSPKPKSNPNDPFTLEEYIAAMRKSPHRYIRLIGEYADEIKPELKTKGQWDVFTRRNVRTAKALEVFSDDQIEEAIGRLSKDVRSKSNPRGFITTWTFETLLKYITK